MRYAFAISVLVLALVAFTTPASADQKTSGGVYLTAEDYMNGKLTMAGESGSGHKIEVHNLTGKPFIHVTDGTETREFDKSSIYGYRDHEGKAFRFVGNDVYEIRDAGKLFIYETERIVRKGTAESAYFFSVGAAGEVFPLTLLNLKKACPGNHGFHDSLDATFRSDSELTRYDSLHKMFKVNRLLVASASER
jgi:hypothetical protein